MSQSTSTTLTPHSLDSFKTRATLSVDGKAYTYYSLPALEAAGHVAVSRLPVSLRVLLENLLRHEDGREIRAKDIEAVIGWDAAATPDAEIAFTPARVILQDFTGVPAVVDMAVMRDAIARLGGDPDRINPLSPADLVIDHSVQVDAFGTPTAFAENAALEYERNRERYEFLRWGQTALANFRVVPPDTGIVHQVNLEYLASVVCTRGDGDVAAFPDTVVGTDSHTTMINGLGVVGWGVGGIEAEAAMLGQPIAMLVPQVVGFRLTGQLQPGATATDLVLTITQMLRKHGVVGKFVEFFGKGLTSLAVADRATIANMAPEYGATIGFFPVDDQTLDFLRLSNRDSHTVALVEAYHKAQGTYRTDDTPDAVYTSLLELDLSTVEPSIAGPKRPQDRVRLKDAQAVWQKSLAESVPAEQLGASGTAVIDGHEHTIRHGSVVIAAITSCTNTSNPSVMLAAGLVARNAAARGLKTQAWVKTSLAPGSRVVTEYLKASGLLEPLEAMRFHVVGYGCTTCIGNSGPLPEPVGSAITANKLLAVSVLSGNRNFEGRVNPLVRANYLASPPLVVAYALAGTMDIDFDTTPLGNDSAGTPVFLKDIWPSPAEVAAVVAGLNAGMFKKSYDDVFKGEPEWGALNTPVGDRYAWDAASTYVKPAPFFDDMPAEPLPLADIAGARVLAILGDSVTTDHISPAGSIAKDSPAGTYLQALGVSPKDFNSYGARRGNHEVMMRGTFANIRLKNQLAPGTEGPWTKHFPAGEVMSIFDASVRYADEKVPLVVLAGAEYGTGSSRDWAAKGPRLLGVRAVIAKSFERIHRSNLIGMGILPLQFDEGTDAASYGLAGDEVLAIRGVAEGLVPGKRLQVTATRADGSVVSFEARCRIDTPNEVDYYRHGGILQFVLRSLVAKTAASAS